MGACCSGDSGGSANKRSRKRRERDAKKKRESERAEPRESAVEEPEPEPACVERPDAEEDALEQRRRQQMTEPQTPAGVVLKPPPRRPPSRRLSASGAMKAPAPPPGAGVCLVDREGAPDADGDAPVNPIRDLFVTTRANRPQRLLFSFGRNVEGQLGCASEEEAQCHGGSANPQSRCTPEAVEALCGTVVNVFCGSHHTLLVDCSHQVWGCGDSRCGQLGLGVSGAVRRAAVLPFFASKRRKVRLVAAGEQHSVFVCEDGVYVCGGNGDGQLGVGDTVDRMEPERNGCVQSGSEVEFVCCGSHHTLLFFHGGLHAFGWNGKGQLHLGDLESRLQPARVRFFDKKNVVGCAAGVEHTVVQCGDGLYVAGGNGHGQLGLGADAVGECFASPQRLRFFDSRPVIGCSAWFHTLVWCEGGGLFGFGEAAGGKLGPAADDVPEPRPVPGFRDRMVSRARAGAEHTAVQAGVDVLYLWGNGASGRLGHGTEDSVSDPGKGRVVALKGHRIISFDLGVDHTVVFAEKH